MNIRERLEAFWAGARPDVIPYTIYWWEYEASGCMDDPAWHRMFADGLGVTHFLPVASHEAPDVEERSEEHSESGVTVRRHALVTPVGEIHETFRNDWHHKYFIETPKDYRVMTWIVEHSAIIPALDAIRAQERAAPEFMIHIPRLPRTPLQEILVDMVGLENFGMHVFEHADEMAALYAALLRRFEKHVEIAAEGPWPYVEVLENFTAETLGPKRYKEFLMPVYEKSFRELHRAGKKVGTHYDGKTLACREEIAKAPMDLLESLTPPPEGDQTLAECRAAWPEKLFWSNLNVGVYQLPKEELRRTVLERAAEAADDGRRLAFEVSEHLPANWRESMPIVLAALEETRE